MMYPCTIERKGCMRKLNDREVNIEETLVKRKSQKITSPNSERRSIINVKTSKQIHHTYKSKALIIADSQGRHLFKHLEEIWPNRTTDIGTVFKPNATLLNVVED